MANPWHHAVSSARRWGGRPEDYLAIHQWFDQTKELHGDFRHRALRHHTHGIFQCEREFGTVLRVAVATAEGGSRLKDVPVKWVAEQHVIEDLGWLPTLGDWLSAIQPEEWMNRSRPPVGRELEEAA